MTVRAGRQRQRQGGQQRQVQSQPGKPLVQNRQGDDEHHGPEPQRHGPLGHVDRLGAAEDEPPDAAVQDVGDDSPRQRRDDPASDDLAHRPPVDRRQPSVDDGKANDRPDDGMRGGNGLPEEGSDVQPHSRRQQRRQHAQGQLHGGFSHRLAPRFAQLRGPDFRPGRGRRPPAAGRGRRLDHTGAPRGQRTRRNDSPLDRLGYVGAHEEGTAELEDPRQDDGPPEAQRPRPHRRAHGVGHVVGADVPSHVQPGGQSKDKQHGRSQHGGS